MSSSQSQSSYSFSNSLKNFMIGGIAGTLSTLAIQPIDIVKVHIQIRSERGYRKLKSREVARMIKEEGGYRAFYKGLDSALIRQRIYSTTRFAIYLDLTQYLKSKSKAIVSL